MTPSQLAWAHFRKASWLGFLILPVGGALVGAAQEWMGRPGYPDPSNGSLFIRLLGCLAVAGAWSIGSVFWGSIFLGIPALRVGLLRQPLMRLLFSFCQGLAPGASLAVALAGTFALFELPVWLLGGLYHHSQAYGHTVWVFCFAVSLPWLLGSLWATWLLRHHFQEGE